MCFPPTCWARAKLFDACVKAIPKLLPVLSFPIAMGTPLEFVAQNPFVG